MKKLTQQQVSEIRCYFFKVRKTRDVKVFIEENFGIILGRTHIQAILRNSVWKDSSYKPPRGEYGKLTRQDVEELREFYLKECSRYTEAHSYCLQIGLPITYQQCKEILKNRHWRDEVYQNRLDHKNGKVQHFPLILKS